MAESEYRSTTDPTPAGQVWHGVGINDGLVSGPLRVLRREGAGHPAPRVEIGDIPSERARLDEARRRALAEISGFRQRALATVGEEEAGIFEIHAMLLEDDDLLESLARDIDEGMGAEAAVTHTIESLAEELSRLPDPYLSARAADLKDVGARLLHILSGAEDGSAADDGASYILVAEDLTPSETVMLDKTRILGFVTAAGTPHSHTAILARAMGIPALVGVGVIDPSMDGRPALLDAAAGTLIISPDERTRAFFLRREAQARAEQAQRASDEDARRRALIGRPAVTRSGHRIKIYANVGDTREISAALAAGAEGIGLLRTEFLYLSLDRYPTEEELTAAYAEIARAMDGRPVVIRTLDIGADKQIDYMHLAREDNPALGLRGIRLCLARKDVFKTQLRAILRASAAGRVAVMFPMIVSLAEVRACRALLEECRGELTREHIPFDPHTEIGIMIETPAAALMSRELAEEVDFFSVGTNDLSQYTLAADRQNPLVTRLCEDNPEPVLRLIDMAARAIHRTGGWIGICGEIAADPSFTARWAALRMDELSVSVPSLLPLQERVTEVE